MIQIATRRIGGFRARRWVAWTFNDHGFVTAAYGLTEGHAVARLHSSIDASLDVLGVAS